MVRAVRQGGYWPCRRCNVSPSSRLLSHWLTVVQSSVKVPHGAEGRDWLSTSTEQRPDQDYWAFQQLAQIARKYTLYLSVGVVEAANVGSTLWCTNLLFGPTGMLLSKHRKIQPTAAERIVWNQGERTNPTGLKRERTEDGGMKPKSEGTDNLPVVSTPVGKIGGLICWESELAADTLEMVADRKTLCPSPATCCTRRVSRCEFIPAHSGLTRSYLAPTADGRQTWLPSMQHIAQEGRCFVVTGELAVDTALEPVEERPRWAITSWERNVAPNRGTPTTSVLLTRDPVASITRNTSHCRCTRPRSGKCDRRVLTCFSCGFLLANSAANQYHAATDFPADYPPSAEQPHPEHKAHLGCADKIPEVWSRGGSAIIGPLGDVLAGPLWDKEGIIYADVSYRDRELLARRLTSQLDLSLIDGAKLDFDPVGHYSREEMLMDLLNATV